MCRSGELIVRQSQIELNERFRWWMYRALRVARGQEFMTRCDASAVLLLQEKSLDVVEIQRIGLRYCALRRIHEALKCASVQLLEVWEGSKIEALQVSSFGKEQGCMHAGQL